MTHQIRRKVQKTGKVSLSITLPKSWIEKTGLNSGDEVILFINKEGNLVIAPSEKSDGDKEERLRKKTINITDIEGEYLSQVIIASYLSGYRVIKLTSNKIISEKKIREIEKITMRFIGLELIERKTREIILQDISSPQDIEFIRFVKRMNKIIIEMLEATFNGIFSCSKESLETVLFQEPMVDKLYYLLSRQLRLYLYSLSLPKTFKFELTSIIDFERIIKRLEGVADHCYDIAKIVTHLMETGNENLLVSNSLKKLSEDTINTFRNIMRAFFAGNTLQASQVIHQSHEYRSRVRKEIFDFSKEQYSGFTFHFLRFLERINSYAADIGEAIININH